MRKVIQKGIVLLALVVPLIFSHATTEIYGLIKVVMLEIGVLLLLIVWLVKLTNAPPVKDTPVSGIIIGRLGWAILVFWVVGLISLTQARNLSEGVKSLYQIGAGIGLFFLILNNVQGKKEVNEIILAIVWAGVLACLYSLWENQGIKWSSLRFAYTSTFGNPVFFSQYLSLAIPVSLAMCLQKDSLNLLARAFFALAALLMLVFLVLTRSRGAYLGLAVAFLYGYTLLWLNSSGRLRKILAGLLVVSLLALSLGLIKLAKLKTGLGENIRWRNLTRVYVWASAFRMVKDHPVLGVGIGNFKVIYPLYRSDKDREITPKGVKYSQTHNDFLQIWAEMGTLGLACFLGILFCFVKIATFPFRQRAGPATSIYTPRPKTAPFRARISCGRLSIPPLGTPEAYSTGGLHLGLCAGIIALLVEALFNPLLFVPVSGMGFWMLLGLCVLSVG